jgi:type I restriction enzyme M protein
MTAAVRAQSPTVLPLVPAGKIRCFITGALRKDTPEENVRQRWARSLVEEYRYDRADIGVEFPIKMGRATKWADLVVFRPGAKHAPDNAVIIVEAKRPNVSPKDKDEGIGQLQSYMHASAARYGLWVGTERVGFEKADDRSLIEGLADIPSRGDTEPKVPVYADLVPALDLKAIFRRCHNYIYANQGLQKAEAFHEMLKLIFCKVYDETESSGELRFYVRNEERRSEAGQQRLLAQRIAPLFAAVKDRYQYIFKPTETIELNRRVLAYVVSELQRISLLRTRADVKGQAYEELVGANLRGDRGEYFTPRNVCEMAVKMALATYAPDRVTGLRVLDVCCGTGGFLVAYLNTLRDLLRQRERAKTKGAASESDIAARIKDICTRNVYGIDINPFLVRTCQMNLVMHGDGSSNVVQADSLLSPSEWDNPDAVRQIDHNSADIVFTNPPFGGSAQVDDPHVLSKYELASFQSPSGRSSMPVEQLFVEAALRFVKPGGLMAIVLPDSILNNPSLQFIREWLMLRTRLVASVDLPKETFAESGGVPNPSVLIVQKLTTAEIRLAEKEALDNYHIFMATPRTAGIDKRANPLLLRTPEGLEVLDGSLEPIKDDEISTVADAFSEWIKDGGFPTR